MRAAVAVAVLAGLAGCPRTRITSDVNAPGKVTLAPPARENGAPELYVEPEDPGEAQGQGQAQPGRDEGDHHRAEARAEAERARLTVGGGGGGHG